MKSPLLAALVALSLLPLCSSIQAQEKPKAKPPVKYFSFEAMRKEVAKDGGAVVALNTQALYYKRVADNSNLTAAGASENHFNPKTAVNTQMSSEYLCLIAVQNARLIQQNDAMIALLQKLAAKK